MPSWKEMSAGDRANRVGTIAALLAAAFILYGIYISATG